MQTLYTLSYPHKFINEVEKMYYRLIGGMFVNDNIILEPNGKVIFSTYFNSFSVEKWAKYTNLNNLYLRIFLQGTFEVVVYNRFIVDDHCVEKIVNKYQFTNEDCQNSVDFDLSSTLKLSGIIYFSIRNVSISSQGVFVGAEYSTDDSFRKKIIAPIICTFKRESYIKRFVENYISSPYVENLRPIIIDNGKTLDIEAIKAEAPHISVFPNANFGGAGGFTRGLLEVKHFNKIAEEKIEYALFMDDDIFLDFSVFERLSSFISLLKEEYGLHFIAGAMCSLDEPFWQYEKFASWKGTKFQQIGASLDLRDINNITINEREEYLKTMSAGWWFSCFSMKMVEANNLPFPCFFRGDDMEFTIRNGSRIISLNGLNVWHEPFYKKYSIVSEEYYLLRNSLVINALYKDEVSRKENIKFIAKKVAKSILKYDYTAAELAIRAVKDYMAGIDFFLTTNPEELNAKLMPLNNKLLPMEELVAEYVYEDFHAVAHNVHDKSRLHKYFRLLSLNGYLYPSFLCRSFSVAQVGFAARPINFFRTKSVLNYDPFVNKGYITHRSFKKAVKISCEFIKLMYKFSSQYKKIRDGYKFEFHQVQSEKFWKHYLKMDSNNN